MAWRGLRVAAILIAASVVSWVRPSWGETTDFSVSISPSITLGSATGTGIVPNPAPNTLVLAGPGIIEYTVTVFNAGPDPATSGAVRVQVAALSTLLANPNFGATVTSGAAVGDTFEGCTAAVLASPGCVSMDSIGALGSADALKVNLTVGSQNVAGATINAQASVAAVSAADDPVTGNDQSAVVTTTVANIFDLAVSKSVQPGSTFFAGGMLTYSVSVANLGVFSQAGGNAAASSNAFGFLVTDLLDISPSPSLGIAELAAVAPASNFSCTPTSGPLPFGGANAPNKVICTFTGVAGLAPGSGVIPVAQITVRTGSDFNMTDAIPDEVENFVAVDVNPASAGVARDLFGGSQPPNNVVVPPAGGSVSGNNLFGPVVAQTNGVVPIGGACTMSEQCVGGSSCRDAICRVCSDVCAPAFSDGGEFGLIAALALIGVWALWWRRDLLSTR